MPAPKPPPSTLSPPKPPHPPRRSLKSIPVPQTVLTALDKSRRCPPASLDEHLSVLLPHLSDTKQREYILNRLINGLTVTPTRLNYTLLLTAVLRRHPFPTLLQHVYPDYTHPRDVALARLALSAAAIRSGCTQGVVKTLSSLACDHPRWRIGDACVAVVAAALRRLDRAELRGWCTARAGCGDGLYLACLLLREGLLTEEAFGKIYDGRVKPALEDSLDTGYTFVQDGVLAVPPVFTHALRTTHDLLGLQVWGVLQAPSAGLEKKLVLLALLPDAARLATPECFDKVFTPYVGNVARVVCTMRGQAGVRLRMDRITQSARRAAGRVLDAVGGLVWAQFAKVTREVREADELCARLLLWCVKFGVLQRFFPKLEILSELEKRSAERLFERTVREFASASERGHRGSLARFLFAVASRRGFVDDAVKIMALYSGFRDGKKGGFTCGEGLGKKEDTYAGCLPMPDPKLSDADAGVVYRRLVEFCAEHGVASDCLEIFRKGLKAGMTPRSKARIDADPDLKDTVFKLVNSLSRPVKSEDQPLLDALRIAAEFVAIQYIAPCEDRETTQRSIPQFRGLVDSLNGCVEAVYKADERTAEGEPTPVERVAHLITQLCAHESASFSHISVKAVEALGHRLDDAVTAVLFDSIESYVSGSGAVDVDAAEDAEEEEEDDDEGGDEVDEDSGDDKNEEEEEESTDEKEKRDDDSDIEMRETSRDGKKKRKEEASREDNDSEGDDTDKDKADNSEGSEDDSDSAPDVDMDPDDEDPEILAQFDRRLAMHIKLINKEKKSAKQRKLRAQFRFTQASRVLSLIESVAKVLRIRIETAKEVDQRTPIVFLDLHSRLYEFALGDEAQNGRFLSQVCSVASKQMMIPPSVFASKITDSETVVEIAKRFLHSIRDCSIERKPSDEETRSISKSAGSLVGAAAALTNGDYAQFLPLYEDLTRLVLSPQHPVNAGILNSFLRKAPAEAATLFDIVKEAMDETNTKRNVRSTASQFVVELAEAVRQAPQPDDKRVEEFWQGLQGFLTSSITSTTAKSWRPLAIVNLVQAASHGIRGCCFTDSDTLSKALSEVVSSIPVKRAERLRLFKLLRVRDEKQSAKRKQAMDEGPKEEDETSKDRKSTRKRKKSRQTK